MLNSRQLLSHHFLPPLICYGVDLATGSLPERLLLRLRVSVAESATTHASVAALHACSIRVHTVRLCPDKSSLRLAGAEGGDGARRAAGAGEDGRPRPQAHRRAAPLRPAREEAPRRGVCSSCLAQWVRVRARVRFGVRVRVNATVLFAPQFLQGRDLAHGSSSGRFLSK